MINKVEIVSRKYRRLAQRVMDCTAIASFICMIGLIGTMDCDLTVDHTVAVILLGLYTLAYTVINADRLY